MEKIFYVYCYLNPLKLGRYTYGNYISFLYEPFYVGKGKGDRWRNHLCPSYKQNKFKRNIIDKIKKTGQLPIIVKIDNLLSNYDAKVLESYLISIIGRRDLELGPLTNHSNGWEEDTYNTKLTTGHKQKLKGHIPWNKKEKIEVACDYCNKKLYRLPSH